MIMGCRYEALQQVLIGLVETGVSFIGFIDESFKLLPEITSDHPGMYYFVPKIAYLMDVSLDIALQIFMYGFLTLGISLFLIGFYLLTRSILFLVYSLGILLLLLHEGVFFFSDVYLAYTVAVFGVIPLVLWFFEQKNYGNALAVFMACAGVLLGYCHIIRTYAALSVIIFIVIKLWLCKEVAVKRKLILGGCLFLGFLIPLGHMRYELYRAKIFLHKESISEENLKSTFWHHIYIGLGFLPNYLNIIYKDECAINKVAEIAPETNVYSKQYDKALRKEVFWIATHARLFVLTTLFAKLGVCLLYFLLCMNFGLIGLYYDFRKKWIEHLPFLMALFISAVPGLLVMPRSTYLSGFSALSFVYGICCLRPLFLNISVWPKKGDIHYE